MAQPDRSQTTLNVRFTCRINDIKIHTQPHMLTFPWQNSYIDATRCTLHVGCCLLSISVCTLHCIKVYRSTYFAVIGQSLVELKVLMILEY